MAAGVAHQVDVVDDQDVGRRPGRSGDVLEGGEQRRGVRRLLSRDPHPEPGRRRTERPEGVEQHGRERRGLVAVACQRHDGMPAIVTVEQLLGERRLPAARGTAEHHHRHCGGVLCDLVQEPGSDDPHRRPRRRRRRSERSTCPRRSPGCAPRSDRATTASTSSCGEWRTASCRALTRSGRSAPATSTPCWEESRKGVGAMSTEINERDRAGVRGRCAVVHDAGGGHAGRVDEPEVHAVGGAGARRRDPGHGAGVGRPVREAQPGLRVAAHRGRQPGAGPVLLRPRLRRAGQLQRPRPAGDRDDEGVPDPSARRPRRRHAHAGVEPGQGRPARPGRGLGTGRGDPRAGDPLLRRAPGRRRTRGTCSRCAGTRASPVRTPRSPRCPGTAPRRSTTATASGSRRSR